MLQKTIVPSNNYKLDLLREKASLNITRKDIFNTLQEVRDFKEEFKENFNDHLSASEFYDYYSEIESIEDKLINEEEKSKLLDLEINKLTLENDKKIAEIEMQKKEKEQEEKNKKNTNNNKEQQNKEQPKQEQSRTQYSNIDYNAIYNAIYRSDYMDEEKTQGGPRM